MRFRKKQGDESTVRTVRNDDLTICYGVVGTVKDLLEKGLFDYCDYNKDCYAFIPQKGYAARFGGTREEATNHLE